MEPIALPPVAAGTQDAWNEAYDRLLNFLNTFALGDHPYVSQLALTLLAEARELHRDDSSRDPVTWTMEHAQKRLADWLSTNLDEKDSAPSHILATGYIALLLSRLYRTAPTSFLAGTVSHDIRQSLRQTLLVAGPDLNVSSMTPRHLDYGPMLQFARQTWHRWDGKEIVTALLFWAGVYTVFYLWLSEYL